MKSNLTYVFFRNDDVGVDEDAYAVARRRTESRSGEWGATELSPSLATLLDIFAEQMVTLDLAVIPFYLKPALARSLMERARHGQVNLLQHGWRHADHGCREFGPCRTFDTQQQEIARGKAHLEALLGEFFSPVFVPPSNKYDDNTLQALLQLGFRAISAGFARTWLEYAVIQLGNALKIRRLGQYPISRHLRSEAVLPEYSISLDLVSDYHRQQKIKPLAQIRKEFARVRKFSSVVGIMLHHWTFTHDEEFQTVRAFLSALKNQPGVRFTSLKELITSGEARDAAVGNSADIEITRERHSHA